jgi:hypothetical protein
MKQAIPIMLCSLTLLSFSSCRSAKPQAESSEVPVETTEETSVISSETETITDSSIPRPETSTAKTDAAADPTDTVLFPIPENPMPIYQGGEGGEDFAETPLPEYFAYRIYENGFSARLAGGNYQSVQLPEDCPPLLSGAEQEYSLFDSDFDGDYDLSIRVKADYGQYAYAVFFWNSESKKFDETPLVLYNPRYDKESKSVVTLQQADEKNVYFLSYTPCTDSSLCPFEWGAADYSALTLAGPILMEQSYLPRTQYDSEEALTDALMKLYQQYKIPVLSEETNTAPN